MKNVSAKATGSIPLTVMCLRIYALYVINDKSMIFEYVYTVLLAFNLTTVNVQSAGQISGFLQYLHVINAPVVSNYALPHPPRSRRISGILI